MTALTHLDADGAAHMVDVSAKTITSREAVATGRITMSPAAAEAIRTGAAAKGDVLAVARIAGIMAAKRTSDLIPLCHPLPLTRVAIDLMQDEEGITATATCRTDGKTGVEMEALTAVTVTLLTIYDMAKAIDKGMVMGGVRLLTKTGGKSGDWHTPDLVEPAPVPIATATMNDRPVCSFGLGDVSDTVDLDRIIAGSGCGPHYVYILRRPDGVPHSGGVGTPFYVGIGQGRRLFAHEDQARDLSIVSAKVDEIRAIWAAGNQVIRSIDSVHDVEPWQREEALIGTIGRLADGTGPLTNAQVYSRSTVVQGIELRKYAADADMRTRPEGIPASFRLADVRLAAGPRRPASDGSVFGKIYHAALAHPGVTGAELIGLLGNVDFSGNKSAYTQAGRVSGAWLAGYVEGAFFRADRQHLQRFELA